MADPKEKQQPFATNPYQVKFTGGNPIYSRDQPNGEQLQDSNNSANAQEVRPANCFWILLVVLLFLAASSSFHGRDDTNSLQFRDKHNSLKDTWLRQKGNGARLAEEAKYAPEQLHLSLGASSQEVWVTWSTIEPVKEAKLTYRAAEGRQNFGRERTVSAVRSAREFNETDAKWIHTTGRSKRVLYTYRARMANLKPNTLYIYRVATYVKTDELRVFYSRTYQYMARNFTDDYNSAVSLAMFGDLGLINGQSIARLTNDVDHLAYDLIIHNGDFAYDLNTHHGQIGDQFMRKIEPIAARVIYQTSVGNHEIADNFSHYDHRFTMVNSASSPSDPEFQQQNNFFYSFNAGPVHFIAISTEFYYFLKQTGMKSMEYQYAWLERELKFASSPSERAKRPWIIVFGHRPMYCSSRSGDDCSKDTNLLRKGLPFTGAYALESLFYQYGVDVLFFSHEHQYERFLPLYDGKIQNGTEKPDNPYHNPRGPVHIISGSAGCQERLDPFMGKPAEGSIKQIADYGFTKLEASRCQLRFSQISDDAEGKVVDEFVITKDKQGFPLSSSEQLFECRKNAPKRSRVGLYDPLCMWRHQTEYCMRPELLSGPWS